MKAMQISPDQRDLTSKERRAIKLLNQADSVRYTAEAAALAQQALKLLVEIRQDRRG